MLFASIRHFCLMLGFMRSYFAIKAWHSKEANRELPWPWMQVQYDLKRRNMVKLLCATQLPCRRLFPLRAHHSCYTGLSTPGYLSRYKRAWLLASCGGRGFCRAVAAVELVLLQGQKRVRCLKSASVSFNDSEKTAHEPRHGYPPGP